MDARLDELELLAQIERQGSVDSGPLSGAKRDLVAFLALRGYVNDLNIPWQHSDTLLSIGLPGESQLERLLHQQRIETLSKVLGGRAVSLRITHAGRIRVAELTQEFRSARIREQTGILWDGRHFDPDLRIRLLDASTEAPVVLAYMDLNGLKAVNDTIGHNAGDTVLQAYFQSLAAVLADLGDAYRLGGDEVGVILSGISQSEATRVVRQVSLLLMIERLRSGELEIPRVSIATGMVITSDPTASVDVLRASADRAMYRAKEFAKGLPGRPSSLAIDGESEIQLIQPDPS
jgi:diguanylate cyclase (GGDEF)-like protein